MKFLGIKKHGLFQSTHPMRDATYLFVYQGGDIIFQSTHPMRDAT